MFSGEVYICNDILNDNHILIIVFNINHNFNDAQKITLNHSLIDFKAIISHSECC